MGDDPVGPSIKYTPFLPVFLLFSSYYTYSHHNFSSFRGKHVDKGVSIISFNMKR